MKRVLSLCLMLGLIWVMTGCGEDAKAKFWEPKKKAVIILEEFADEFEKASTPEEIASAFNTYADKIEALEPELNKMTSDPNYKEHDAPRYIQNRESMAMNKYVAAADKVKENLDDPDVKDAYQRFVDCTNLSKGN